MKKISVAVLFGGRSGEHEVSIVSARSVIASLDPKKYRIYPIGITKEGEWVLTSSVDAFIKRKGGEVCTLMPDPRLKGISTLRGNKRAIRIDVVFPVLHGTYGEDGALQGLLELTGIPYVGPGVLGSSTGMDKDIMKRLFMVAGLPVVQFISFTREEWQRTKKVIVKKINRLKYPVFVKPANLGSSVGITKIHSARQLSQALALAFSFDRKVVVERGIERARDIECAVLGNDMPRASLPGEIISSNEFYDYDAKYVDGQSQAVIPPKISQELIKKVQRMSLRAFQSLDLMGMARVDFLLQGRTLYINELNTIPGFTAISMYPKLWEASGVPYPALLDKLINFALSYHKKKNALRRTYTPKRAWYSA
ncbi:MAG: D-alanine--D-alanine ligase family protein [Patescibacteria group bacterium]